ncbi:hypothetical protein IV203_026987 [Nitzschia inconspicua]|uniref:Uncharacterized protein n=1 Tax=Nitzschia inconspicua TaxID=303405 RepID=A0A9K3PXZ6_9STRA|nr:hypothetical protein IV203_026987 [Nitzschia inconspicua]
MPIDLKWVRDDPEAVEEWQRLRGRDVNQVQRVLQDDETSRAQLSLLQQSQRRLSVIKRQLRPSRTTDDGNRITDGDSQYTSKSRVELLDEKHKLEEEIQLLDAAWKECLRKTEISLWKLASPVDIVTQSSEKLPSQHYPPEIEHDDPTAQNVLSGTCMDLKNAWRHYTTIFFAEYQAVWVRGRGLRSTVPGNTDASRGETDLISPDKAHAIWGCTADSTGDFKSCTICRTSQYNHVSVMNALPTWTRVLIECLPAKSIWGDSQLPTFSAIWGETVTPCDRSPDHNYDSTSIDTTPFGHSFSLDLVALTASSLIDARRIQSGLVEQLERYYGSLLVTDGERTPLSRISRRTTSPSELEIHEFSRIELFTNTMGMDKGVKLGSVSCWGDAASRACGMVFAGGGVRDVKAKKNSSNNGKKEFVYIVQATVVDQSTWGNLIAANSSPYTTSPLEMRKLSALLGISSTLLPYLNYPIEAQHRTESPYSGGDVWIEWKSLAVDPVIGKDSLPMVFRRLKSPQLMPPEMTSFEKIPQASGQKPKFPLSLNTPSRLSNVENLKHIEVLTSPFGFLFKSHHL